MKFNWNIFLKEITARYWNFATLILALGFGSFLTIFYGIPNVSVVLKMSSFWIVFFTYIIFCYFNHWRHKDWKDLILSDLFYIIIIFICTIGYMAASVKEGTTLKLSVLALMFTIYGGFCLTSLSTFIRVGKRELKKRESNILMVSIFYVAFVFSLVWLYTTFYAMLITEGNRLIFTSNNLPVNEILDFVYFSASNFYASTYGDILPIGNMRFIAISQVLVSFIIHVLVISWLTNTKNK